MLCFGAASTLVLLTAFQSVRSLKCFVCNSIQQPDCGNQFGNNISYVMDCEEYQNLTGNSLKEPMCYTARDRTEYLGRSEEGTERGCTDYKGCGEYLRWATRHFFSAAHCHTCDAHLCNGKPFHNELPLFEDFYEEYYYPYYYSDDFIVFPKDEEIFA